VVGGYSLVDLELVIVAEKTGLLDVALDAIVSTSCFYQFDANLSNAAGVNLRLEVNGDVFADSLSVTSF
jgi:hypothetical protein